MKRIRSVIHYFTDTWASGGGSGEVNRASFIDDVETCEGWGAKDSFPSFVALTVPSSSLPVETVAIFLVFDDLKISSRSHGKIEMPHVSLLLGRTGNVSGHPSSSFPLYFFYFALCLSTHPRFPLYASTADASIPKEERAQRLDLRMNIPSAGEFITFIYTRVSDSYPSTTPDRQTWVLFPNRHRNPAVLFLNSI